MNIEIGSLYKIICNPSYQNYQEEYFVALEQKPLKAFIKNSRAILIVGINLKGEKQDYILTEKELQKVA